jgi:cell division septation protein DedD
MTRMADPVRPRDDQDYDDERFEDEGRRSIFSALWFRAILVVIVLGVVAAVAVPYVLELANQPAPKNAVAAKPEMTPPPVASPAARPAPPIASAPVPAPPVSMPEKSSAVDKPAASESTASATPAPPAEKPAAPAPKKSESSKSMVAASKSSTPKEMAAAPRESAAARAPRAPSPTGASGDYFVQVGAFKNPDTARKLAGRLREQKYSVEETSLTMTAKTARPAPAAAPQPSGAANDRYDVHVTGATPAEINAKLAPKGLSAEPSGAGVVVKPSMALRDAVALSKDLAVDGLKVQVRRAAMGAAPAPAPASAAAAMSDGTLYRVRVGPFDDKTTATSTLRELEQRGYSAFIARGGQ